MEGFGAGAGLLVHWTGVMDTGFGGGLSGRCVVGKMVTICVNVVGVSFGTLGEGVGQYDWNTTAGGGCGAFRVGAVGGLAVALENIQESVWMAEN